MQVLKYRYWYFNLIFDIIFISIILFYYFFWWKLFLFLILRKNNMDLSQIFKGPFSDFHYINTLRQIMNLSFLETPFTLTISNPLKCESRINHFSFTISVSLFSNGSRIFNRISILPPTAFRPLSKSTI